MPSLVVTKHHQFEREWCFEGVDLVTIGRSSTNDIPLPDPRSEVSRYHACLVRYPGDHHAYFLRDLSSLHYTKVNDEPVIQRPLVTGDVIGIGPYRLLFTAAPMRTSTVGHGDADLIEIVEAHAQGTKAASGVSRQSTKSSGSPRLSQGLSLSAAQQEVFTAFLRKAHTSENLATLCQGLVASLAKLSPGANGLIGLFTEAEGTPFRAIDVAGLDPKKGERITIRSKDFIGQLKQDRPVVEAQTVLVPLHQAERIAGFLCLQQRDRQTPFSQAEVEFLVLLGRSASIVKPPSARAESRPSAETTPSIALDWPAGLIGRSEPIKVLSEACTAAALTDDHILLTGSTGTGKEVAATLIHRLSSHARGPFLAMNCSTLTETLAESELFGYAPKSGIAGADPNGKPGLFELAKGGVLFLDEIHTLSLSLQAKLLRVLEAREVWRLGGRMTISIEVKIVAATNEDLERAMAHGTFRSDLFYRFGRRLTVPSLAERAEDVVLLAHYFLDTFAHRCKRGALSISREALQQLGSYAWPGNVRELRDYTKAALDLKRDVWLSWDLPPELRTGRTTSKTKAGVPRSMKDVEKDQIKEALDFTRGNKTEAARILGFHSRQTLLNKMDEFGISRTYGERKSTSTIQ